MTRVRFDLAASLDEQWSATMAAIDSPDGYVEWHFEDAAGSSDSVECLETLLASGGTWVVLDGEEWTHRFSRLSDAVRSGRDLHLLKMLLGHLDCFVLVEPVQNGKMGTITVGVWPSDLLSTADTAAVPKEFPVLIDLLERIAQCGPYTTIYVCMEGE